MLEVVAIRSFDHQRKVTPGQLLQVSPQHATQLAAKGLVRIVGEIAPVPRRAAGVVSPSLPAAPVLPPKTSKESTSGATRPKRKRKAVAA